MLETVLTVQNELGLHARAAARLVHATSRFQSRITFYRLGRSEAIDGKSILGILMMAAACGSRLGVTVDGPDEQAALSAIKAMFQNQFEEKSEKDEDI